MGKRPGETDEEWFERVNAASPGEFAPRGSRRRSYLAEWLAGTLEEAGIEVTVDQLRDAMRKARVSLVRQTTQEREREFISVEDIPGVAETEWALDDRNLIVRCPSCLNELLWKRPFDGQIGTGDRRKSCSRCSARWWIKLDAGGGGKIAPLRQSPAGGNL